LCSIVCFSIQGTHPEAFEIIPVNNAKVANEKVLAILAFLKVKIA
jgi:hypothetical protein